MMIIYNKLVRDNIPKIIKSEGFEVNYKILDEKAYKEALIKKLDEELTEYHKDRTLEELADILEVINALTKTHNSSPEELEKIRKAKAKKKGGFSKRIFLIDSEG